MPTNTVPSVALVLGSILVPGSGLCLAIGVARSRGWLTFAAASLGCGFVATASISLLLALVGLLNLPALVIGWILLSGITWFTAIRSRAWRGYIEAWRRDVAADPWATITAAATVVAFAAVRWTYPPIANMGATAMRYWADALEIADHGGIPASTLQWGTLLRPATSKSALNAFNGSMSLLSGQDPLPAMGILLFIVSVGLVLVVMAVFTELGIRRLAPIGALFLFANQALGSELTADLTRNLAENWGRLSAFTGMLLAVVLLSRATGGAEEDADGIPSGTAEIVLTGWVLGATAAIHLVAAAVGALFVGSYMLARIM
ncbi:MAG TPA: hypothetical protein VJ887_03780, partial [Actinomycetota bacterium]|nr:hypothetical protein [Actinomycetota bacterium]